MWTMLYVSLLAIVMSSFHYYDHHYIFNFLFSFDQFPNEVSLYEDINIENYEYYWYVYSLLVYIASKDWLPVGLLGVAITRKF